jgi:hypothetical protein
MSKKKHEREHEVVIVYKRKRGRPSGVNPLVAWHIRLDDEYVGTSDTLNGVSALLWDLGYSTWAFRRYPDKKGRPCYKASVYKHKESVSV